MGNHHSTGHFFNLCGCTDVIGFEGSAKAVINMYEIKPWNARSLIRDNLTKQGDLARKSPLRKVPVLEGLEYFQQQVKSAIFTRELTKDRFVEIAVMLLGRQNVPHNPREREELYEIFDSMDFDKNGTLSLGEWAAGLSVFFKGTMEQAVRAVFRCLDSNEDGAISKTELQVYLSPFVKAMSPPEAAALRPILEKKAVDDIYYDMDMDHQADISTEEMLAWSKRGNNIVDRLADIIDQEVYQLWLAESKRQSQKLQNRRYADPSSPISSGASSPGSNRYESMEYQPEGAGTQYPAAPSSQYGQPDSQRGYNSYTSYGPPQPSEYGPAPGQYQTQAPGYSGNYQSSYTTVTPQYGGGSPSAGRYGGGSPSAGRPGTSAQPPYHDPFAAPRSMPPPPPPPPAPGRGAVPGYAAGGLPQQQPAYSSYGGPCPSSSPQYRGRY
mmetsp:Transcript_59268/g.111041  ORF Transcript_59268/g.111041 Transcript_59268/m.111041 type:complete len:439 (-) Transcript_59268:29-1345(-)